MSRLVALALGLAACVHGSDTDIDEARTCIVTVTGGLDNERVLFHLDTPGHPIASEWAHDGTVIARATYEYDAAGRMVREVSDSFGDGKTDSVRTYVHSATETTLTFFTQATSDDIQRYTVDAADRVTRLAMPGAEVTYELDAGGRLVRSADSGVDPELGAFTRSTELGYDAMDRPITSVFEDSRMQGGPFTSGWTYEDTPGRLVVTTVGEASSHRRYVYLFDDAQRVRSMGEDADRDGVTEWTIDVTYGDDGAIELVNRRPSSDTPQTTTYSSACGYEIEAPRYPRAQRRPGTEWTPFFVSFPNAYI